MHAQTVPKKVDGTSNISTLPANKQMRISCLLLRRMNRTYYLAIESTQLENQKPSEVSVNAIHAERSRGVKRSLSDFITNESD